MSCSCLCLRRILNGKVWGRRQVSLRNNQEILWSARFREGRDGLWVGRETGTWALPMAIRNGHGDDWKRKKPFQGVLANTLGSLLAAVAENRLLSMARWVAG